MLIINIYIYIYIYIYTCHRPRTPHSRASARASAMGRRDILYFVLNAETSECIQ